MSLIQELSYLVIESDKIADWKSYAEDFLGMQVAESAAQDALRIRMDERPYRLLVKKPTGGEASEDLWALGLRVNSVEALDAFSAKLRAAGVDVHAATPEELAKLSA